MATVKLHFEFVPLLWLCYWFVKVVLKMLLVREICPGNATESNIGKANHWDEMDKVTEIRGREITGEYHGISAHFYRFDYDGTDNKWHAGELFPIQGTQVQFDKGKGCRLSFWTFAVEKEREMRELTSLLHPIAHGAFMQPVFCVYNSQIEKGVVASTPCTGEFISWISKQKPIPADGYIPDQGKNMIISVLSLANTMWTKGFVCCGLNDPNNYRMMDFNVKVIPFRVRKKVATDNEMMHRLDFATLLENEIYPKWKDPELMEFIILMRGPLVRLECLLSHPLLLEPEKRLALYQFLWPGHLSARQNQLLSTLPSLGNWRAKIRSTDDLYDILTYEECPGKTKQWTYGESAAEAFRFGCDVSAHFMQVWRNNTHFQQRRVEKDLADKSLKKLLPGLLAQVYRLAIRELWTE